MKASNVEVPASSVNIPTQCLGVPVTSLGAPQITEVKSGRNKCSLGIQFNHLEIRATSDCRRILKTQVCSL